MICGCGVEVQFYQLEVEGELIEEWLCPLCNFNHDYDSALELLNEYERYKDIEQTDPQDFLDWWKKEGGMKTAFLTTGKRTMENWRKLLTDRKAQLPPANPRLGNIPVIDKPWPVLNIPKSPYSKFIEYGVPGKPFTSLFPKAKPVDDQVDAFALSMESIDRIFVNKNRYIKGETADVVIVDEVANKEKQEQ